MFESMMLWIYTKTDTSQRSLESGDLIQEIVSLVVLVWYEREALRKTDESLFKLSLKIMCMSNNTFFMFMYENCENQTIISSPGSHPKELNFASVYSRRVMNNKIILKMKF